MAKKSSMTCALCDKPILDNECFVCPPIPGVETDVELWRHKKCGPGSKVWISKFGTSKINDMLCKKRSKKAPIEKDPIHAVIKAFCGRDKYLRYMDSISGSGVNWELSAVIDGVKIKSSNTTPPITPDTITAMILVVKKVVTK